MKREIKFRGLQPSGKWVYGFYFKHPDNEPAIFVPNSGSYRIKEGTEGQYTGLTDKSGKEIFDGDVLTGWRKGSNSDLGYTGVIEWQTQQAGWVIRCGKFIIEIVSLAMSGDGITTRLDSFEVIGNIFENPDLIKTT